MAKFTARDHKLANLDYRNAVATNLAQKAAGLPRFHFKFDVNSIGQRGGSYKVVGIDEQGEGSITGNLTDHIANQNNQERTYSTIGLCSTCSEPVRKTTTGGKTTLIHNKNTPTDHEVTWNKGYGKPIPNASPLGGQFRDHPTDENFIIRTHR